MSGDPEVHKSLWTPEMQKELEAEMEVVENRLFMECVDKLLEEKDHE